ncbi:MAG: acetylornithine deacetylase [Acidimicrobiaceae bacterium]|nr:acetylornithine deacetylase [Acidimicrobiaceae bacterium]
MSDLLARELEDVGFEPQVRPFAEGQANVHAFMDTGRPGPCLLLAGHIDTVNVEGFEAAWGEDERSNPFSAALVDGKIWGRGTADQKGGVASILGALSALRESGARLAGQIHVALVGDEEAGPGRGTSAGIKAYVKDAIQSGRQKPTFAIYTEPTSLDVYASQIGFMIGTISVVGKASYFSTPWNGRDAIRDGHRVLEALYAYERELAGRTRHRLLGRPALLVTTVAGGESVSVAEHWKASFIRSVPPTEDFDEAKVELDEILQRLSVEHGIALDIVYTSPRDSDYGGRPYEVDAGSKAVDSLLESAQRYSPKARLTGAQYWSEIGIIGALGAEAVYFGPGDISICHTPLENVPVAELTGAARTLACFAADYLST